MLASPLPAGSVLADSTRLGDAYFMAIGPAIIFLAVVVWVAMTLLTSRKPRRPTGGGSGMPHRGPVQGGVLAGSPSQRTRRDPAPSVTHREVMAHIERARAEEQAAREEEERARGRPRTGRRRAKRSRRPGSRKPRE